MDILQEIADHKRLEVEMNKKLVPVEMLKLLPSFNRNCLSLSQRLKKSDSGIIAEFKRRSPSIPDINLKADPKEIPAAYEKAGACGISILTDEKYFGGSANDLLLARETVNIPILRKDFIVDTYQIIESKAFGADVILLIAAILTEKEILEFSNLAKEIGLEVLFEVHNEEELKKSSPGINMTGVNNRDLKTFKVDLGISKNLSEKIDPEAIRVSESGISSPEAIKELRKFGYRGFLIGEHFMKSEDPGKSAIQFISAL